MKLTNNSEDIDSRIKAFDKLIEIYKNKQYDSCNCLLHYVLYNMCR